MMWRQSAFDELFDVFRDFDGLFRRTFAGFAPVIETGRLLPSASSGPPALAPATWATWPLLSGRRGFPAVESYAKDGRLFIRAELPGVEPSDVQVSVTGNRLQIGGEKKVSREVDENDVWIRETSQGRFERVFTLPQDVKSDQIEARYENGVLELSMPAPAEPEPKNVRIEVKPAPSSPAKAA